MHPDTHATAEPGGAAAARPLWQGLRAELADPPRSHTERSRSRSAMLNQLLLCAIVLVVAAMVVALGSPDGAGLFLVGMLVVFVGGAVTLVVPWQAIARGWMLLVPLADIFAIALLRQAQPTGGLGLLWAFPAMWMATLGVIGFIVQFATITAAYWTIVALDTQAAFAYSTVLLPVVILAIAMTSFLSTRRFTAQQVLLDKQAVLLTGAMHRAQHQEQLVTEVLDAVDFGVVRVGPDGTVTVVNEALGRFQSRIPGFGNVDQPDGDAFRADGTTPLPVDERPLRRALRGEVFDNQIVWYTSPGERRWAMSMTARRLRDADGKDAGCVLMARDVTSEMTALRARDRLVASVSHELRTPLTSVLGYIDLAIDHLDHPEQAAKDLEVAGKNGERLLEIVSDILAASSSSRLSVDMTISPEDVDMAEIVRTAAQAWRPRAAEQAISIADTGVEAARAYADPLRIRQVVDNLISNAVKYNRDGGEVVLGTTTDGVSTWVLVRDTGIGIDDADQKRLFERFFRARTGVDGTGLGLSISRDIVRAHGGDVTVHSALGAGSTFIVRIPASAEAARLAASATDAPPDGE
ncbi:MAG: ATP-binding protein [Microbacterium sp.]|uniref:ATP-binding protein n=1 Tax=Microbacterium sp. TaxID=51671 RepID=UPI0039E2F898